VVTQPPHQGGQDIQHGVLVRSDVDKDIKQEQEHVLVVVLVLHHVLVHLLKEGLVEGLEHQPDGQLMGLGVNVLSVVEWEDKHVHEVVSTLIHLVTHHVEDQPLNHDLVDLESPPRDGQDTQHGVLVLSDVELELRQEPEHVLVVVLVLHHVLVHLLKEGLVEGLEPRRDGHLMEHGVLVQSDVELEHKHEQEVV